MTRAPGSIVSVSAPVVTGLRTSIADRLYPTVALRPQATLGSGYTIDAEYLLANRPLVMAQPGAASAIGRLGLCTIALGAGYGTRAGIAHDTRVYAALAALPGRASALLAYADRQRAALALDLARLPHPGRPRVLLMGVTRRGEIMAQGASHPARTLVEGSLGRLALDAPLKIVRLDIERVAAIDPDVIFLGNDLSGTELRPTDLAKTPLHDLRAVRQRRVYGLPPAWTWLNSVVETPAYARWMAAALHPGLRGSAHATLDEAYRLDEGVALPPSRLDAALPPTGQGA